VEARYDKLKTVFLEAVHCDVAERDALLDKCCGDDHALRHDVERMLAHDAETLSDFAGVVPERFGDYTITGLLGAGGMGVVYRARQLHPARDVAIKALHPSIVSHSMLRRFRQEAELLGRVQHQSIAQIYEASSEAGRPFIVMELVDGEPITRAASDRKLDERQRIELILQVCHAVQHAHDRGIVHRDLKPSNALVDRDGQVKILDFGIARALDPAGTQTMHTATGELVGTIPYMSPEQLEGRSRAIDGRSDVFAIGVLLYQLLTGRMPFDVNGLPIAEAARVVLHERPTRLSEVDQSYRGDLETIVSTAMAREPERRYPTAAAFAEDLRRYMQQQPITARPPSSAYRLRKFAQRNPAVLTSMIVIFLILIAATAIATMFAIDARHQSQAANTENSKLRAANQFLEDMLNAVAPNVSAIDVESPKDVRVVQVLDWAAEHVHETYDDQPLVEASLHGTLARAYDTIGRPESVRTQYKLQWELLQAHLGADDQETLKAKVDYARSLAGGDGLELVRESIEQLTAVVGDHHELTIGALNVLAAKHFYSGDMQSADRVTAEALRRAEAHLPDGHDEHLTAMNNRAYIVVQQGDGERGDELYRRVLEAQEAKHGPDDHRTIGARLRLVHALMRTGKVQEARQLQAKSTEAYRRIWGDRHPRVLFEMNNLAYLHAISGAFDEALRIVREAISGYAAIGKADTDSALVARNNEVLWLTQTDRHVEAEPLARKNLAAWEQFYPGVPGAHGARRMLMDALVGQDRHTDAETMLLEAHDRHDSRGDEAEVAHISRLLSELYDSWDRPEDAAAWRVVGDGGS